MGVMLAGRLRGLPLDVDELASTHSLWAGEEDEEEAGGASEAGGSSGKSAAEGRGDGSPLPELQPHAGHEQQGQLDEQQQAAEQETVRDGHAFTVGVHMLLRGAARRKSMRLTFAPQPEPEAGQRAGAGAESAKEAAGRGAAGEPSAAGTPPH